MPPAVGVLDQQLVEELDLGAAGVEEVEALQRDLTLGGLAGGFHVVLRRQVALVGLGRILVLDAEQLPGLVGGHAPLSWAAGPARSVPVGRVARKPNRAAQPSSGRGLRSGVLRSTAT